MVELTKEGEEDDLWVEKVPPHAGLEGGENLENLENAIRCWELRVLLSMTYPVASVKGYNNYFESDLLPDSLIYCVRII